MTTPTQRTVWYWRRAGAQLVEVVEHYNAHIKRRQDLFGLFDVLVIREGETLAVQTTSYDNVSARINKLYGAQASVLEPLWAAGWRTCVEGWRGERRQLRVRRVYLSGEGRHEKVEWPMQAQAQGGNCDKQLLSILAAARALGVAKGLVYRAAERGQIPTIELGARRYISATTIEDIRAGRLQVGAK